MSATKERNKRDVVVGVVTSDRMQKTISVRSEWRYLEPRYERYMRMSTTYKVHDEKNEAHIGDTVEIMATRPLSKTKCWRLVRVLSKGTKQ